MNHYILKRPGLCLLACILFLVVFPLSVCADMGPKPSITITVENPPDKEYYLDLLVNEDLSYKNLTDDNTNQYDSTKLSLLETYDTDNWYPCLVHGTKAPMFGTFTSKMENGKMKHTFGYYGIPSRFRIIIITPDNEIVVSNELNKTVFQESVSLDYASIFSKNNVQNSITVKKNFPIFISYLKQFFMTLIPTLFIEGLLLLLFRFSIKQNWKPFVFINLLTQLAMTIIMGTVLIKHGLINCYYLFIPLEIIITIAESIAYAFLLNNHTVKRRVAYAITANFASALVGLIMLSFNFSVLFG